MPIPSHHIQATATPVQFIEPAEKRSPEKFNGIVEFSQMAHATHVGAYVLTAKGSGTLILSHEYILYIHVHVYIHVQPVFHCWTKYL